MKKFARLSPISSPGSDVANLSLLGYNPVLYYPGGRGPIEAASIGVKLAGGVVHSGVIW